MDARRRSTEVVAEVLGEGFDGGFGGVVGGVTWGVRDALFGAGDDDGGGGGLITIPVSASPFVDETF